MTQTLIIGIDLGNSNCSLSYLTLGESQSEMVPLEDGQNKLPSAVFFPSDGSEARVGAPAHTALGKGWLFENFKGRLMEEAEPTAITAGGLTKSPKDALTTLLSHLAKSAFSHGALNPHFVLRQEQYVPREPIYLTLGVPAQAPEHYKTRLRRACVASGWVTEEQAAEYLSFVAEPVAVALNYPAGERRQLFIYDHGGLTLDMVRIQLDQAQSPPYKVLAYKERVTCTLGGRSYDVGGSFLDRLLLRHILSRAGGVTALQSQIMEAYETEFETGLLEKLVQMEQDPLPSGAEARVYAALRRDVERLRIGLSSPDRDSARLFLSAGPSPVQTKIVVKKSDLDDVFSDVFQAIRQKLPASVGADEFCFMVGGCSLTPSLQGLMKDAAFGTMRVIVPNAPMEAIARGLSRYHRASITGADGINLSTLPVDDIVDTDYGIWNGGMKRWDIVLAKGTSYSDAVLPERIYNSKNGTDQGVFKVYRPMAETRDITLRVGQRDAEGKWIELGERDVHLPTPTTNFRLYFSIDPHRGQIEIRLFSNETKKMIRVTDTRISMHSTKEGH